MLWWSTPKMKVLINLLLYAVHQYANLMHWSTHILGSLSNNHFSTVYFYMLINTKNQAVHQHFLLFDYMINKSSVYKLYQLIRWSTRSYSLLINNLIMPVNYQFSTTFLLIITLMINACWSTAYFHMLINTINQAVHLHFVLTDNMVNKWVLINYINWPVYQQYHSACWSTFLSTLFVNGNMVNKWLLINNIILHVDQHINQAVDQQFVITLLINSSFLVVDQQCYPRPLINAVDVSVDQRPHFGRRNTWTLHRGFLGGQSG